MKLKRRDFLGLTTKLAVTVTVPSVLVACGGGGGGSASVPSISTTSSIDSSLTAVNTQQTNAANTNTQINSEYSQLTSATSTTQSFKTTAGAVQPKNLYEFFSVRTPDYSNSALLSQGAHYLITDETTGSEFWQGQVAAHQKAYKQYADQLLKLKATLRLFDSKVAAEDVGAQSSTARAKSTAMAVRVLEPAQIDLVGALKTSITETLANLDVKTVDILIGYLQTISSVISGLTDLAQKYALSLLAQFAIDEMLEGLATKTIANLEFSDKESIMLSIGKISVASMAIIGASKIAEFDDVSNTETETKLIESMLSSGDLAGKLSLVWLSLLNDVMSGSFSVMNEALTSEVAAIKLDADETNTEIATDNAAVASSLRESSAILAIISLSVKSLFGVFADRLDLATIGVEGFNAGSTAEVFSLLFSSEENVDNQVLSAFATENNNEFISGISNFVSDTESDDFNSLTSMTQAVMQTSSTPSAANAAVDFATTLAEFAYNFTDETETDAVNFATHLADLAFEFTMDIEEDAFQFALQGMEYGYLFASQGEDVGVMADRILWMAVQIGVMADRIGEMADRIVYTEQLIVYTEVLILDFGILIYGVIKQITNLILTGLALILDREWYEADSEDIVLKTISGNVTRMLNNMNQYSLAVLENQIALREATLDALDTVNFAA